VYFPHLEGQTEQDWKTVEELQQRISLLEASLKTRAEFHVDMLTGNNKLTRLYTGLPTYGAFKALAEYLEPKAVDMIAWNSSQTKELDLKGKQGGSRCSHGMSVANQLFCMLARLRIGLSVGVRFKISEGTCSRLFTTWMCLLAKEFKLLLPFPSCKQIDDWMPRSFKS